MAGSVRTGSRPNILNTDGQPHPVENILTVFTLVVGLVSFVLGMIIRNAHTGAAVIIIATATGHDRQELVERRLDGALLEIGIEDDHELVMAHKRPEPPLD